MYNNISAKVTTKNTDESTFTTDMDDEHVHLITHDERQYVSPKPANLQVPAMPHHLRLVRDARIMKDLNTTISTMEGNSIGSNINSISYAHTNHPTKRNQTIHETIIPGIMVDRELTPTMKNNVVFLTDDSPSKPMQIRLNMNQHYLLYNDYVEGALQSGKRRNSDFVPHLFQTLGDCHFELPPTRQETEHACAHREDENFATPFSSNKTLFRRRGATLPPSFSLKTHRRRALFSNIAQTIFQRIIMHDDLFFVVTEFLCWRDLLALTHTCSQLFNLGATLPFVWKNCLYSFKANLESKEHQLHKELKEKAELATVTYCHFETFREVYEALAVPAENKSVKCFEQMHDIMNIEGRLFFKKISLESKARWEMAERLLSQTSPRNTSGCNSNLSSNCKDDLTELLQPCTSSSVYSFSYDPESCLNEEMSPFLFSPQISLECYDELYKEKVPLDWKGLIRYFYSPQSFYDACLADFSKLRKILEFFQLSFKPYPELLVLHTFYLNYNENANPKVFTSSTRAFVGWSFFFGKFLESNLHLIHERNQNFKKRDELERQLLPFILKKFSRDFV